MNYDTFLLLYMLYFMDRGGGGGHKLLMREKGQKSSYINF
jgi:hypothetical protein